MDMDQDQKFILLVVGLPIAGFFYCGLIVLLMINVPAIRHHPLGFGLTFFLVPFITAAVIWLRASAQAYGKRENAMKSSQ